MLQQVKEKLYNLEGLDVGSDDYHQTLTQIMASLHHHNDDEEIKDLPLLEAKIGEEGSKAAAASFKRTKKLVPTRSVLGLHSLLSSPVSSLRLLRRSHPSAPNKPPFETLAGLLAAPIDKVKDWFSAFPTEEEMKEAKEELKTRDHDAAAGRAAGGGH